MFKEPKASCCIHYPLNDNEWCSPMPTDATPYVYIHWVLWYKQKNKGIIQLAWENTTRYFSLHEYSLWLIITFINILIHTV